MSENIKPSPAANETAEKILAAIYGEDLQGCTITPDKLSGIIQEGLNAEVQDHKSLAEALIGALRQIQVVSTPPSKEEVKTIEDVANILGQRADAIHQITTKILEAWDRASK